MKEKFMGNLKRSQSNFHDEKNIYKKMNEKTCASLTLVFL